MSDYANGPVPPPPSYPPAFPGSVYPPPPPAPYAAPPAPLPPAQPRKSPVLGRVAFIGVVALTVIATIAVVPLATVQSQLVVSLGNPDPDSTLMAQAWLSSAPGPLGIWAASLAATVIAMIIGLIAAISRRGRGWGIAALIAGVLSPVAWILCWLIVAMPGFVAVS